MSGDEVPVTFDDGRTNIYTVTMDMETGMWSGAYKDFPATVDLGTSTETQDLTRDEQGGWWTDPENAFSSGGTVMSSNGNSYTLTYTDEGWSSMYVPVTMMIAGTTLTAVANENDGGYSIEGLADQVLDENGMGDVMTADANYRVHMDEDGNLMGVQYEMVVDGKNKGKGHVVGGLVVVGGDNKDTVANETGTTIKIDGEDHSTGDLFTDGESSVEGDNIVAGVLEDVSTLAAQIKGLIAVNTQENPVGDGTQTDFSATFRKKWKALDTALDTVFGDGDGVVNEPTDDDPTVGDTDYEHIEALPGTDPDPLSATAVEAMVEMLDAIVAALSDGDTFAAAAAEDGIFKEAFDGAAAKRATDSGKVFNAVDSTATAYMARTANTRFGVYSKQTTEVADLPLGNGRNGSPQRRRCSPTRNRRHGRVRLQPDGDREVRRPAPSRCCGIQWPDDGDEHGRQHPLQRRHLAPGPVRGKRVSGLVENLMDGDGNLFEYAFGKVAAIILAEATITTDGSFEKDWRGTARSSSRRSRAARRPYHS